MHKWFPMAIVSFFEVQDHVFLHALKNLLLMWFPNPHSCDSYITALQLCSFRKGSLPKPNDYAEQPRSPAS